MEKLLLFISHPPSLPPALPPSRPPSLPPALPRRSKLYVFGEAMLDKGSGKKTWLERGIGEVKLLK